MARHEVDGQLELPLFEVDRDQADDAGWITADSKGPGPVVRWRQIE